MKIHLLSGESLEAPLIMIGDYLSLIPIKHITCEAILNHLMLYSKPKILNLVPWYIDTIQIVYFYERRKKERWKYERALLYLYTIDNTFPKHSLFTIAKPKAWKRIVQLLLLLK